MTDTHRRKYPGMLTVHPTEPAYARAYAYAERVVAAAGLERHSEWRSLQKEYVELIAHRLLPVHAARVAAWVEHVCARIARHGARRVLAWMAAEAEIRGDEVLRRYLRAAGNRLGRRPPQSVRRRLAFERAYRAVGGSR